MTGTRTAACLTPDDYPAVIRTELARHRSNGRPFAHAWNTTLTDHPAPDTFWLGLNEASDRVELMAFMRRHFEAAYNNDQTSYGRVKLTRTDTSSAVQRRETKRTAGDGRCRSGDGCSSDATHGRFGPTFCEVHYVEFARLFVLMETQQWRGMNIQGTMGAA